MLALLGYLASVGFAGAPRPVGVEGGEEVVTFVPGDPAPDVWPEEGTAALGALLRDLHA